MAVIFLLLTFVVSLACGEDSPFEEFTTRMKIVKELDATYQKFKQVNREEGKNESAVVLAEFLDKFEKEFDNSDLWLLNAMTTEEKSANLVTLTMNANRYNLAETQAFIDRATAIISVAILCNYHYHLQMHNVSAGAEVQGLIEKAKREMATVQEKTTKYLTETAWRTQFRADALDLIAANKASGNLVSIITKALAAKYPFRAWMVLQTRPGEAKICYGQDSEKFVTPFQSGQVIITEMATTRANKRSTAQALLSRVDDSKKAGMRTCSGRAESILMSEANYDCKKTLFPLAAVFESKENFPKFTTSRMEALSSKLVYRARMIFWCKAYFRIIFFG